MTDLMAPPDGPKVLLYDIENTPILGYVWDAYEANLLHEVEPWHMLCFAYKWLGQRKTGFVSMQDQKDDRDVAKALHTLFDQADILVAHNGDRFDMRKANQRFLIWGLDPPSPYFTVDTLKAVRRTFAHAKNNLDFLAQEHGLGAKLPHQGLKLWLDCMDDKSSAWKTMERYNRRDVVLLEKFYLKIRGWIPNHPNIGYHYEGMACINCGSGALISRGPRPTKAGLMKNRWQCKNCGKYSSSRNRESRKAALTA